MPTVSTNPPARHHVSPVFKAGIGTVILVALIGGGLLAKSYFYVPAISDQLKTAKFVTAAPFDPEQIGTVSKFRSCAGHDYSGMNIDGVKETMRSMKHYVTPIASLQTTTGQVKVFAPFDGEVIVNKESKRGDNFNIVPTAAPGYIYELGHIAADDSIKEGSQVKAGQLVGYYDLGDGGFDVQFWYGSKSTVNTTHGKLDSLFAHMTPDLSAKLAVYGLTPEALIATSEYRDAHPCQESGEQKSGDASFVGNMAEDLVTVKNAVAGTASSPATSKTQTPANTSSNPACAVPADQLPPGCK